MSKSIYASLYLSAIRDCAIRLRAELMLNDVEETYRKEFPLHSDGRMYETLLTWSEQIKNPNPEIKEKMVTLIKERLKVYNETQQKGFQTIMDFLKENGK